MNMAISWVNLGVKHRDEHGDQLGQPGSKAQR
jgi:hypothetical protein